MSTHEPVPALSSIAVDPSPYSSLQYTYHSQPLHDILYNEPMIPSYPNVESSFTQRPHPHYSRQLYPSPYYFRSQHPNPNFALIHSAIAPTFNPRFSHDLYRYGHHLPQRPRLGILSHPSLYHYNVPSYQTTTANTLTHSSQFSHDPSHDGPPLPQRPRLGTPSLAMVDPLATATDYHSSSHVTHSLPTPFSPHVGNHQTLYHHPVKSFPLVHHLIPLLTPPLIVLHHNTHLLGVFLLLSILDLTLHHPLPSPLFIPPVQYCYTLQPFTEILDTSLPVQLLHPQ